MSIFVCLYKANTFELTLFLVTYNQKSLTSCNLIPKIEFTLKLPKTFKMRKYFFTLGLTVSVSLWFLLFAKLFSTEKTNLKLPRTYLSSKLNLFDRHALPTGFQQFRNESKGFGYTVLKLTPHVNNAVNRMLNATPSFNDSTSDLIKANRSVATKRLKNVLGVYGSCLDEVQANALSMIPDGTENNVSYFKDTYRVDKTPVKTWITGAAVKLFCDNNIRVYNDKFAMLKDTVLDIKKRKYATKKPKGGEQLKDVLGQAESDEFFEYTKGFWKIRCESNVVAADVRFPWFPYLDMSPDVNYTTPEAMSEINIDNRFTIAITREDYVNLHNFVRQMYNTFLLLMIFKKQPKDVAVLFLDGHPKGILDKPWYDIFGKVTRAGTLPRQVLYKTLVWGFAESDGGLTDLEADYVPYIEEFRSFFLHAFRVNNSSVLNCKHVTITIILRRDKVFHPRNKQGMVGRKIFNEDELIEDLMKTFPNACVQAVLMDALPLANQLQIISSTDILIGMHGAGMTHTVFLPRHAAVLEIFPKGFKTGRPWFICYEKIANWRNLKYASWENFDSAMEMAYDYTILDREQVLSKVKGLMKVLC